MSSHHIVRDEQEPALLLWQPGQASWEETGQLLEWSPRVIVHQQALPEALSWGMKLDAVWAPAEALEDISEAVAHQAPVTLHSLTSATSAVELAEVVDWLKSKNQYSLNLLADAAADNFAILRQAAFLYARLQIQVISQGWRYSYFGNAAARKWLPEGSRLKLIFFGEQPDIDAALVHTSETQAAVQLVQTLRQGMVKIGGADPFWLGEQI